MRLMIARMESSSPPGVSSSITRQAALFFSACSMASEIYLEEIGLMTPFTFATSALPPGACGSSSRSGVPMASRRQTSAKAKRQATGWKILIMPFIMYGLSSGVN